MSDNRKPRYSFILSAELREQVDEYCEEHGLTFSGYVRMACVHQLRRKPNDPPLARAPRGRPRKE